ncbi:MAG: methionyl-tRNA formyltransferase [Verrucomicrobia bacterium RIFCSPHIGHO2_12_FULL_41_10]|nr:MAG: methionyl-tRNA formyltransferase [Verrucomicrobia bacterium RIFCSPHIGHO2_12_FULL_41_10]HLB34666.1 methionyl-tRNA formyltransferase [Chthoniobacterales bacterium]
MRILFAGTSEIGEKVLRTLFLHHEIVGVLTQPDRPAGRHRTLQPPAIKKILQEISPTTPLLQPENLRDLSFIAELRALQPEVMVTMAYGKILPLEILSLPSIACLNIHASLLPRYRGASPIQAVLAAGDSESGITIMYMAEGLDTGDILLEKKISLDPKETAGSLSTRLATLAPEALLEALTLLEKKQAPRFPQDEHLATLTHCIERTDALLDWTQPAIELERKVRAMNPKPGAHGVLALPSGKQISLKIFSSTAIPQEALPTEALSKKPGSLFKTSDQILLLLCGNGALNLHEVQPEGRSRMNFSDFARGQIRD